ncbi:hypothetical protein SI65_10210 [Aspergillus cristatus]|uniref:Uncharacterized protein n=1 Tax=Aspergillus cristatus TaxID=573508 RepID=A0A1E3B0C3_ASPCR|nr:hypothetical protein SI65_10210 [Aspergillus cristatus]
MPPSRSIADFFKRPGFALNTPESPTNNDRPRSSIDSPTTSPLTEPPSSSLPNHASPPSFNLPTSQEDKPQVKKDDDERPPQPSFQSADSTVADNSSRRMINGKEVVISSDGEDTDSIASLESPEELFAQLGSGPNDAADKKSGETRETRLSINDVKLSKFNAKSSSVPKYKNTLDALVTDAVDDNETEASIAKIRATIKLEEESTAATGSDGQDKQLHEGMLTSALGDKDDELGLQRLLDAVRRTEAFDHEKAWSFFSNKVTPPPAPEFPRDSVAPGTYLAVLREPGSRERAFHSGIVDFALSKQFLPDELVTWIFHSVPAEPRDELRQVYCRVFKHATAERVRSLIRPNDIDLLFQRLGATPKALALREPVSPDPQSAPDTSFNNQKPLLSLLELLRGAADLFADDARERILVILFRLTIDISLMKDTIVCSEVERSITTVLEAIPEDGTDDTVHRICTSLYDTVKDPAFQSRLLKHTLPTSSWISLLRCRLAVAYLTRDPTPLTEPPEAVLDLKRMTQVLRNPRFDVKLYKGKGCAEYDYGELGSIITLLNIAIDPGWTVLGFPRKDAEKAFNAEIDVLADRIKKIFTSIEDSGVSHLKRTLAKEGLEALHYRVLYSVRSKPQPRKVGFQVEVRENNGNTMNNYFGRTSKEGGNMESSVKDEGKSS